MQICKYKTDRLDTYISVGYLHFVMPNKKTVKKTANILAVVVPNLHCIYVKKHSYYYVITVKFMVSF